MITISTSHHKIWNSEQVVVDIIKEYLKNGKVVINLKSEGPCAESIGLYKILDNICDQLNFCKSNIFIETCNFEECHNEYIIIKNPQHWINTTINAFNKINFSGQKDVTKNLFGCLYNIPSWDRLCLLSHVYLHTDSPSMLHCNGVYKGSQYNSYYLNDLIDFFPEQFFPVTEFLKSPVKSVLADAIIDKPVTAEQMLKVTHLYNDFFIDIVAETYNQGLSFFITEKTLRPMLTLTPFIIQGPKSFLKTLKSDYNVKSFDNWWNEDYDNYNGSKRIDRIFKLIDDINKFTMSERIEIYKEIQPVLQHNRLIWTRYE